MKMPRRETRRERERDLARDRFSQRRLMLRADARVYVYLRACRECTRTCIRTCVRMHTRTGLTLRRNYSARKIIRSRCTSYRIGLLLPLLEYGRWRRTSGRTVRSRGSGFDFPDRFQVASSRADVPREEMEARIDLGALFAFRRVFTCARREPATNYLCDAVVFGFCAFLSSHRAAALHVTRALFKGNSKQPPLGRWRDRNANFQLDDPQRDVRFRIMQRRVVIAKIKVNASTITKHFTKISRFDVFVGVPSSRCDIFKKQSDGITV